VKTVWPIVALVVIAGCVWFLTDYYKKQPAPGQTVLHKAPVACASCGKAYITMLGDQPAKCFFCGQQTLWRARQCAECGAIIPVVGGPSHGASSSLVCPKCGKSHFKEVSPDGLEEH
jgi:DNA-directed RNA polymerase subunit RPC12/RpoP